MVDVKLKIDYVKNEMVDVRLKIGNVKNEMIDVNRLTENGWAIYNSFVLWLHM